VTGSVAQEVDHPPSKHETLSQILVPPKKQKQRVKCQRPGESQLERGKIINGHQYELLESDKDFKTAVIKKQL
jgi:hypothetical protein